MKASVATLFPLVLGGMLSPSYAAEQGISPHFDAVALVMELRADEVAKLEDPEGKWHDVDNRTWAVRRPVHPGVFDTTHFFQVSYSINDKVVATWTVNTKLRLVGGPGEEVRVE
jgi:hypothetical protein